MWESKGACHIFLGLQKRFNAALTDAFAGKVQPHNAQLSAITPSRKEEENGLNYYDVYNVKLTIVQGSPFTSLSTARSITIKINKIHGLTKHNDFLKDAHLSRGHLQQAVSQTVSRRNINMEVNINMKMK